MPAIKPEAITKSMGLMLSQRARVEEVLAAYSACGGGPALDEPHRYFDLTWHSRSEG